MTLKQFCFSFEGRINRRMGIPTHKRYIDGYDWAHHGCRRS